ncbi:hypothetical protein FRC04_000313 [Tulasnella sp. 424]|nr:hypothetical protein FRC04_000313 [Tulasnella sp. 424]
MLRRVLPLAVILFNFILAIIAIVDLARGFAFDSYVAASSLLCVTSVLTMISLSLITFLNFQQPDWMPYAYLFELCWASILCLFQFISAVVMSSEPVTGFCQSGEGFTVKGHNICPTHQATLAFAWTSWLLLLTELILIIYTIFTVSRTYGLTFRAVLTTTTEDLDNNPIPLRHNITFDMEKSLPRAPSQSSSFSGSSTGSGRRKHRPPPLDLAKVSNTSLPIYHSYAKAEKAKARGTGAADRQRSEAQRPSRHQIMAQVAADSDQHPYAAPTRASGLQRTPSNASNNSIMSNWTAPAEWEVADPPADAGSRSQSRLKGFLAGKKLPSLPGAAMTNYPSRSRNGGVVDRPDPRDRRPVQLGELQAEGGFWMLVYDEDDELVEEDTATCARPLETQSIKSSLGP